MAAFVSSGPVNFSETTFVLPPKDPAHTANVRIFMVSGEAPFAGHPNVGTATVLAWKGELFGKPIGDTMSFEEIAGIVDITVIKDPAGNAVGLSYCNQGFGHVRCNTRH